LDPKPQRLLAPLAAAAVCVAVGVAWLSLGPDRPVERRIPLPRPTPEINGKAAPNPGTATAGRGKPSSRPGSWPGFRGANRDNVAANAEPISPRWPPSGPRVVWRATVGEGHAGAAIHRGRVYLVDYDREREEDAIRCLSLDDGAEIWRFAYSVVVKRNHGMSRTIPAVNDRFVVALGPKAHVHCLDADTGRLVWKKDLVAEYGAVVPLWYAGQCPLIDGDRAILAPGGKPLMMAVALADGAEIWRAREHDGAGMTHSSIAPFEFQGRRQYLYCAADGLYSVAADDGTVLWTRPDWKIKIANIPTPLPVGEDRIFLTGGYGTGSRMIRLKAAGGAIETEELFRLPPTEFGSDQQTPILYEDRIYGVRQKDALVCLSLDGKIVWESLGVNFGLGPYMIADGRLLALQDQEGILVMAEAAPSGYKELARAKVLSGHDAWGPMAMAEGRLIVRDLTEMVCLNLNMR